MGMEIARGGCDSIWTLCAAAEQSDGRGPRSTSRRRPTLTWSLQIDASDRRMGRREPMEAVIARPAGLLQWLHESAERLGQVERLAQVGQPLGDQRRVGPRGLGHRQRVSPYAKRLQRMGKRFPCDCRNRGAVPARVRRSVANAFRRQDQGHGHGNQFADGQGRGTIGADDRRLGLRLFQKRPSDLLAVQKRLQRRAVEDLLGPIRLDRGGAMELQRPARHRQQQIAAEQAVLRIVQHGQEPQNRLRVGVARTHWRLTLRVDFALFPDRPNCCD